MKKINQVLVSSTVALALIAASPLLASAHDGSEVNTTASAHTDVNAGLHIGSLLHFGTENGKSGDHKHVASTTKSDNDTDNDHASNSEKNFKKTTVGVVSAISSSTISLNTKGGTVYTVTTSGAKISGSHDTTITLADIHVGDTLMVKGAKTGTTVAAEKIFDGALEVRNFVAANGAVGAGVVTSINGSTFTVKPFGTNATTTVTTNASTTFQVNGQPASSTALSVGSRVFLTGTTTSPASIGASIVNIFSRGFGFFKHLFRH